MNLHDGVYKLTIPCVSCYASGINDEGLKEIVEGIDSTNMANWQSK